LNDFVKHWPILILFARNITKKLDVNDDSLNLICCKRPNYDFCILQNCSNGIYVRWAKLESFSLR